MNEFKNALKRKEFIFVAILSVIATCIDVFYVKSIGMGMLMFTFFGIPLALGSIVWLLFSKNYKEIPLRVVLIVLLVLMLFVDLGSIYAGKEYFGVKTSNSMPN